MTPHLLSRESFDAFIARNSAALDDPSILKAEPEDIMQSSYLLVDERGHWLDSSIGGKDPSPSSVLHVGALRALAEHFELGASFNKAAFIRRDGAFYKDGGLTSALAPAPAPAPIMPALPAVEVEVKFAPPAGLEARLQRLCAEPPLRKLMRDIYWDAPGHALTAADHWLRERDGRWELKAPTPAAPNRVAGELRVDCYDEWTAWPDISRALARVGTTLSTPLPPAAPARACLTAAGLAPFVDVESARRSYNLTLAGHKVRVELDTARFHHPGSGAAGIAATYEIGEVELVAARAGVAPRAAIKEALDELGVSAETPVRGKLLEFIFHYRQSHWRALAASGLLADKLGSAA